MGTVTRHFHDQLLERVTHLVKLFEDTLKECEGRTEVEIAQASDTFLAWAAATERSKDKEHALTVAWSKYGGICCGLVYPSDGGFESFNTLPFNASPPWEREETALIAGFVLAEHARHLLQGTSHDGCAVAAMLYADAVEAREFWDNLRGMAKCRHPSSSAQGLEAIYRARLARHHRSLFAKKNAEQRLANDGDGKQAAKKKVEDLWLERHAGQHPKLRTNEQFAAEAMRQFPELTTAKTILGWCTKWNKEAKSRSASR